MHANNLTNLLDALTDTSVYVIEEDTHRLLYFNQRCQDMERGKAVLGAMTLCLKLRSTRRPTGFYGTAISALS